MGTACVQPIGATPYALKYVFGSIGQPHSTERTAEQILDDNGSGTGDAVAGPLKTLLKNTKDWGKFCPEFQGVIQLPADGGCPDPPPPPPSPTDVRLAMALSTYYHGTIKGTNPGSISVRFEGEDDGITDNRRVIFDAAAFEGEAEFEGIVEIRFNHSMDR
jgi:hypothetical protein